MSISVKCESCGASYKYHDDAAGKKFKCKKCGGAIRLPAKQDDTDEDFLSGSSADEAGDNSARHARPAALPPARRSKSSAKRKGSTQASGKLPLYIGGGAAALVLIGVVIG